MSGQATKHGLVQQIPVEQLDDSPFQVRTSYGDIEALARDVERHGLLQPILVRPRGDRYEIVHGHRRTLAIKKLHKPFILAVVRELDDESAILIHGSENIHRKDLTPIEEGTLYRKYMEATGKSVAATAKAFQVSRDTVRDKLNLLDLPEDIQDRVHSGDIDYRKARKLTILTREPADDHGRRLKDGTYSEPARRTDRWYPEIRELAGNVSLRTEKEVARTARLVREGAPVEEAVHRAKMETARDLVREGPKPEEVVQQLKDTAFDVNSLREASLRNYLNIVQKLVAQGRLYCPDCGGKTVVCRDCGRAYSE